jgi:hypothetical protein
LRTILDIIKSKKDEIGDPNKMLDSFISQKESEANVIGVEAPIQSEVEIIIEAPKLAMAESTLDSIENELHLLEDRTNEEIKKAEEEVDLYNINNFSL